MLSRACFDKLRSPASHKLNSSNRPARLPHTGGYDGSTVYQGHPLGRFVFWEHCCNLVFIRELI
jgi:hypothetical protein